MEWSGWLIGKQKKSMSNPAGFYQQNPELLWAGLDNLRCDGPTHSFVRQGMNVGYGRTRTDWPGLDRNWTVCASGQQSRAGQ